MLSFLQSNTEEPANNQPEVSNTLSLTEQELMKELAAVEEEKTALLAEIQALTNLQKYQLDEIQQLKRDLSDKQADLDTAVLASANSSKLRSQFLMNLSHDIRTPMNAVAGFTALLESHLDNPDEAREYLDKIKSATDDLLIFVNNVVEIAQIQSGRISLDERAYHVADMHQTLVEEFAPRFEEKGIKFKERYSLEHGVVICDVSKIHEIMYNLLDNACKYTLDGGTVSFEIDELPHEKEGYRYYQAIIKDNGMGIAPDLLPRIFDEFTRERSSTESRISGTGLGMPIVKSLVEMMGGTIHIESEEYVGTTIVTRIPHKILENDAKVESVSEKLDDTVEKEFRGKRILLAEDNDLNGEIAIAILEDAGFSVEWAKDGIECVDFLDRASDFYFDVVLMDIQMPNMDGYRATRTIRQMEDSDKKVIPILAMTANALEADRKKAFEAGMDGYLTKPINVSELLDAIRKAIGKNSNR